jgi:hypothetical protein
LVILRGKDQRSTEASQSRLTKLGKSGACVIHVETQPVAEMAAYQAMLTAAQTGDLTRSGKPVEVADYDSWVTDNLSEAVKEFIDLVFVNGT